MTINPFDAWLVETGVRMTDAARAFDMTPRQFWGIRRPGYRPDAELADRIFAFTLGAVAQTSFYETGSPPSGLLKSALAREGARLLQEAVQREKKANGKVSVSVKKAIRRIKRRHHQAA